MYGLYAIESRKWDLQKNSVEIEPIEDEYEIKDEEHHESRRYARSKSYSISCSSNVIVQGYNCKVFYQKRASQVNNNNLIDSSISNDNKYDKNFKIFESYIAQFKNNTEIEKLNKSLNTSNFNSNQRRTTSFIPNENKISNGDKNNINIKFYDQKQQHQSLKERQNHLALKKQSIIGNCDNKYNKTSGREFFSRRKSLNEKIRSTCVCTKRFDDHTSENCPLEEENLDMITPMQKQKPKSKKFLRSMFSKFKSYSLND
jgi:hypothetical protein